MGLQILSLDGVLSGIVIGSPGEARLAISGGCKSVIY